MTLKVALALGFTVLFLATRLFGCETDRVPVRKGLDKDARLVNLTPKSTTIEELTRLPKPKKFPENSRVSEVEKTTWEIRARITRFKKEKDGGYHIVVDDGYDHTLIVELPNPTCMKKSPFLTALATARKQFEERIPPATGKGVRYLEKPVSVIFQGVGFFRKARGPLGFAPNGIELNPVTLICFEEESCKGI